MDGDRPKEGIACQAPGKLCNFQNLEKMRGNCACAEDSLRLAQITCGMSMVYNCAPLPVALANKVLPNNGVCGDIKHVQTLVTVTYSNS